MKDKIAIPCILRARLAVESIFGILTQSVCVIFVMPIAVRVNLVDLIVQASCQNFIMRDFTLTYDATLKLRLCRMLSFGFCGVSKMIIFILIIHILPKFILHKLFCYHYSVSTINQPESRQRRNRGPNTSRKF